VPAAAIVPALVVSLSSVAACHGEREEARRAEAGRIAHAVEALRNAPNEAKRPLLSALERESCSSNDVCAVKKDCTTAYSATLDALDALAAVRHAARDPGPLPSNVAVLLTRTEADLRRAQDLATKCADAEAALRRSHHL